MSLLTSATVQKPQSSIIDKRYHYWLLYRNDAFDQISRQMQCGILRALREWVITKQQTKEHGQYRVLKARNIGNHSIIDIPYDDAYIDDIA